LRDTCVQITRNTDVTDKGGENIKGQTVRLTKHLCVSINPVGYGGEFNIAHFLDTTMHLTGDNIWTNQYLDG
jgi:hypothetical protein